ncbi:MAG: hypothetical protein U1E13_12450 [Methylophilaceae bacterium]|nr:hypothetical protein [Methylophilaceae bacterium]
MKYRKNDAPDSKKVSLELTMGQWRMLEHLVDTTLAEVEEFGPEGEYITEKALQRLTDRLMTLTHIELTAEEKKAATDAWLKSSTHKEFIRMHGFDPLEENAVRS